MKSKTLSIGARLFVLTAVMALAPAMGYAQEQSFLDLTLRKSYVKRDGSTLLVEPTIGPAFTPTSITCPGGGGNCTMTVEFDGLLLPSGTHRTSVRINGQVRQSWTTVLLVDPGYLGAYVMPRFVATIAPGTHVVEVFVSSEFPGAYMGARSLQIDVLK
jgi:hypothetical protein